MVDFRKWLIALAAVGLLLGIGSSAAQAAGFACTVAPTNNNVRAEGVAELVGDVVLNCTGGTPTPTATAIPLSNVTVSMNVNVTSRIVGFGGISEALMLIDDPYPATIYPAGAVSTVGAPNALNQLACLADNSTNCAITQGSGGAGTAFGASGPYNGNPGHFNVFQGVQTTANSVTWTGVPIDAPGTGFTRIIRFTNIRADANQLGVVSSFAANTLTMLISVNGNTTLGSVAVTGTVATVYSGILTPPGALVGQFTSTTHSTGAAANYAACSSVNVNTYLQGGFNPISPTDYGIGVTVTEGFAYAWRPQQYSQYTLTGGNYTGPGTNPFTGTTLQDVPGYSYNTESGFMPDVTTGLVQPTGVNELVGLADNGTRLQFAVAGVGAGITLYAPSYVYLNGAYASGAPVGVAVLVGVGPSGSGAFSSSSSVPVATSNGAGGIVAPAHPTLTYVAVTPSANAALLTYEIYYSNPSVQESLTVPISVSYTANTATGVPAATTSPATVTVSFSPQNTTVFPLDTGTTPIPRFGPSGSPVNLYTISSCSCDLLFPFVTTAAGFDTGVAIANTSLDPFGTPNQSGTVALTFYPAAGGASTSFTTTSVPAGQELVFDVYSGDPGANIQALPNFTGYMIAQANFQYCHGFAFVSDLGAQKLAEGYLAIVLNPTGLARGVPNLSSGENLGH